MTFWFKIQFQKKNPVISLKCRHAWFGLIVDVLIFFMNWICPRSDEKNPCQNNMPWLYLIVTWSIFEELFSGVINYQKAITECSSLISFSMIFKFRCKQSCGLCSIKKQKNHFKRCVNDKHIVKEKRKRVRRKEKLFTV